MKIKNLLRASLITAFSLGSFFGFSYLYRHSQYLMPAEYKIIKRVVNELASSNNLGDKPITFSITAGSYTSWRAEDLKLCKEDSCSFYDNLDPYKDHKGASSKDVNEAIRQAYLLGGIEAWSYPNGTITISQSSFKTSGDRTDALSCTIAHEIAHFQNHDSFKASLKEGRQAKGLNEKKRGLLRKKISRELEKRADQQAAEMMFKAGYPSSTCLNEIDFLYKISGLGSETKPDSTHPGYEERMESLRTFIANLKPSENSNEMTKGRWTYSRTKNALVYKPLVS